MRIKLILTVAVLFALVSLYVSGTYAAIDPEGIQVWIRGAGAWGGALFVAAYACLQPLGVRSVFFLLSAPLIWSPAEALVLNWVGAVVASVLAFGFARFVARDWAQERAPERVRRLDARLATHGFRTVTFLRLVFYTTPALQLALGVSQVKLKPFLFGTAVGVVPFTVVMTFFGAQISTAFWRLVS